MNSRLRLWPLVLLWALLMAVSLAIRTFVPIDETRYVTVAWEMWLRGDFLVPHLNGAPYAHKPPLLFWLYDLGWWVTGVNDWWPRLVAPLFGLASLFVTAALGRRLWPDQPARGALAAWLLFGSLFWTGYTTVAMFDMLVAFFTVLGLWGLWRAGQGGRAGWVGLALAIGLGILAKGPVILLHLLPAALLGPWWSAHARGAPRRWYLSLAAALTGGALIALAWALPAAWRGGEQYAHDIFWGQTANRMVDSFAHKRPLWWYLPLVPLILWPWVWWPRVWRGLKTLAPGEPALRFLIAMLAPAFVALCLISGKQVHYLLPLFPPLALLLARGLDQTAAGGRLWLPALLPLTAGIALLSLPLWPRLPAWLAQVDGRWGWLPLLAALGLAIWRPAQARQAVQGLTLAAVVLVIAGHGALRQPLAGPYDLRPMARRIADLQAAGVPLAHESKYAGEYHFLGRLKKPLTVVYKGHLPAWAKRHPNGYIILYFSGRTKEPPQCPRCFVQGYRGDLVALIPADWYLGHLAPKEGRGRKNP